MIVVVDGGIARRAYAENAFFCDKIKTSFSSTAQDDSFSRLVFAAAGISPFSALGLQHQQQGNLLIWHQQERVEIFVTCIIRHETYQNQSLPKQATHVFKQYRQHSLMLLCQCD